MYYQFSIETFGWFNIDVLLKGLNGVEESELFIRIIGEYREKVQVYIIIPSVKVYVQGGPAERNSKEFAFLYKNGKLPLPQGTKAYIMAVTEAESTIAYALKEFTTNTSQELEITLQKSTSEAFNTAINGIDNVGINIKASDSKNAREIRNSDSDLNTINEELKKAENLKPKNCDCNCLSNEGGFIRLDSVAKTNDL